MTSRRALARADLLMWCDAKQLRWLRLEKQRDLAMTEQDWESVRRITRRIRIVERAIERVGRMLYTSDVLSAKAARQ